MSETNGIFLFPIKNAVPRWKRDNTKRRQVAREGPSQIQFYILFPGYLEEMLSLKRPPFCQFFLPDVLLFSKGRGKGQQSDLDNGSTQETFQEERYPQSGLLLLGSTKNLEQFNVRVLLGVKIASRSESTTASRRLTRDDPTSWVRGAPSTKEQPWHRSNVLAECYRCIETNATSPNRRWGRQWTTLVFKDDKNNRPIVREREERATTVRN